MFPVLVLMNTLEYSCVYSFYGYIFRSGYIFRTGISGSCDEILLGLEDMVNEFFKGKFIIAPEICELKLIHILINTLFSLNCRKFIHNCRQFGGCLVVSHYV